MARIGIALVALAFAVVTAATSSHASDRKTPPVVGEAAPELKLGDQHGKVFVLAETLKGKEFVVLAFYPKAFTSG